LIVVESKGEVIFRRFTENDEVAVYELIGGVFEEFIAREYTEEGVSEFRKYIVPEAILQRYRADFSFAFLALDGEEILGFIEVRDQSHIMLFFVREDYHQRGIGRALFSQARDECLKINPGLAALTVNSSPYAVPIYERLGFVRTGAERMKNGIRHTPMIYNMGG
jgi:GNAT superfamily N-acetyltransferase